MIIDMLEMMAKKARRRNEDKLRLDSVMFAEVDKIASAYGLKPKHLRFKGWQMIRKRKPYKKRKVTT